MSIDTAATPSVASVPAGWPVTPALPAQENEEPVGCGRWQTAVAMLAGLAAGAMIVAGVAMPW